MLWRPADWPVTELSEFLHRKIDVAPRRARGPRSGPHHFTHIPPRLFPAAPPRRRSGPPCSWATGGRAMVSARGFDADGCRRRGAVIGAQATADTSLLGQLWLHADYRHRPDVAGTHRSALVADDVLTGQVGRELEDGLAYGRDAVIGSVLQSTAWTGVDTVQIVAPPARCGPGSRTGVPPDAPAAGPMIPMTSAGQASTHL
jgi:hypothetical protein